MQRVKVRDSCKKKKLTQQKQFKYMQVFSEGKKKCILSSTPKWQRMGKELHKSLFVVAVFLEGA